MPDNFFLRAWNLSSSKTQSQNLAAASRTVERDGVCRPGFRYKLRCLKITDGCHAITSQTC